MVACSLSLLWRYWADRPTVRYVVALMLGCSQGAYPDAQMCDTSALPRSGIALDPTFTPVEVAYIEDALATWSGVQCKYQYVIGGEPEYYFYRHASACGKGRAGCVDGTYVWLTPMGTYPGCDWYTVALHEVGHMVGMSHTEYGIMQPRCAYVLPRVTEYDRKECVRRGVCSATVHTD